MACRAHLPKDLLDVSQREVQSSLFAFSPPITLVSYVPKKNKNVLLLSTMHTDKNLMLSKSNVEKPEIILYYNHTKAGVDTIDQMCRHYSTKVASRRWPMVYFFNMLDIAAINAHTLYKRKYSMTKDRRQFISRKKFLYMLALSLVADCVSTRDLINLQVRMLLCNGCTQTSTYKILAFN